MASDESTPSSRSSSPVPSAVSNAPERIASEDSEIFEEWLRPINDVATQVNVVRIEDSGPWQWQIYVGAMEFVREPPLETDIREAMRAALEKVPGVTQVEEEDTEKWIVDGEPTGEALAIAAAAVVDSLADRTRAYIQSLR
jgi:hypothetical protein